MSNNRDDIQGKNRSEGTPLEPETLHCKFAELSGTVVHMNGCDSDLHPNTLQETLTCSSVKQITVVVIAAGVL